MIERRVAQQPFAGPEKRRRGRPRLVEGEATTTVTIRLTTSQLDQACRLALRREVSVSAVLRDALARLVAERV